MEKELLWNRLSEKASIDEDPTGKSDEKFKIVIEQIRNDILELRSKLDKE